MTKTRPAPFWTEKAVDEPGLNDDFYDEIKRRFAEERDVRLALRPEGNAQFLFDLTGELSRYEADPFYNEVIDRRPLTDAVDVLLIGGGFSALLASVRLRELGVKSIRIVERGADVGGTWYWNRYPGVACDVVSYDYLPLLDEMSYVPTRHYPGGEEIYAHCRAIAKKYGLYDLAVFQTTVTSTTWDEAEHLWHVTTDRGDTMKARFVICANGTITKPKLAKIEGMDKFRGHSFHTSRWDYVYTGQDLSGLSDKVVGIIGTGASAVQIIPNIGAAAKELFVFQRTPSSIDLRDDWETDPDWAASLKPGWQAKRREAALNRPPFGALTIDERPNMSKEERDRLLERANIDYMMRIHRRIEEVVEDKTVAEALKPWYMFMCKRPCFHNDYLPTFNRPTVHLVDTRGKGITQIGAAGPIFEGQEFKLDLLIYATGFEVFKTGVYNQIRGIGGREIDEKYRDGVRTLLGIHTHGYPNFFIMGGSQASYQFNMTDVLREQGNHIAACIDYVRKEGFVSVDASASAEAWWIQTAIASGSSIVGDPECTPGYYNAYGNTDGPAEIRFNAGFLQYRRYMQDVLENPLRFFDLK